MESIEVKLTSMENDLVDMRKHYAEQEKRIKRRIDEIVAKAGSSRDRRKKRDSSESRKSKSSKSSASSGSSSGSADSGKDRLRKKNNSGKTPLSSSPKRSVGSKASTPKPKVEDMDAKLGGFYGSTELRDALKEAQTRLLAALQVLQRVKEYVNNPCVKGQIGKLFNDISTMNQLFNRMMDRMEIPDSEDFFVSESNSSFTDVNKKTEPKD